MHQGSYERPRRYRTNCGAQAISEDAFYASCAVYYFPTRASTMQVRTKEPAFHEHGGGR